jgi:hypothetical protein
MAPRTNVRGIAARLLMLAFGYADAILDGDRKRPDAKDVVCRLRRSSGALCALHSMGSIRL